MLIGRTRDVCMPRLAEEDARIVDSSDVLAHFLDDDDELDWSFLQSPGKKSVYWVL